MPGLINIKNKKSKIIFKRAAAVLLLGSMAFSLAACKNGGPEDTENPDAQSPSPSITAAPPAIKETPRTENSASPESSPPVSEAPEEPVPPDIPLRETPAEDSFFEDAAFMGNSLMDGFRLFSGLTTPDYYTATSMSVLGATSKYCVTLDNGNAGTMVDGLTQKPYGKIYILLGINEISLDVEYFIEHYSAMLDAIMEVQTECTIYVMGISPVSAAKSSAGDSFNMTRIGEYNEALRQMAADKGCYYMDLVEALADDTGYLPAAETTDGVHFSANLYSIWLDYVRHHYV